MNCDTREHIRARPRHVSDDKGVPHSRAIHLFINGLFTKVFQKNFKKLKIEISFRPF